MSITPSPFRSPGLNRKSGLPAQPVSRQHASQAGNVGDTFQTVKAKKADPVTFAGRTSRTLFGGGIFSIFAHKPLPSDMVWLLAGDDKSEGDDYDQLEPNLDEAFGHMRLSEDRNWSGRSLTMEAVYHGNYKEALLIASYGGDPDEEYDKQGRNTLRYVDARRDLTETGKQQLKDKLVELYNMRTTVQDHPGLKDARKNIPDFVNKLPSR